MSTATVALNPEQVNRLGRLIVRLVSRHPELTSRAVRAADLVARVTRVTDETVEVQSASNPRHFYAIHSRWGCHCKDIENGAPKVNGRKVCKHQLAVQFATELELPGVAPKDPPPELDELAADIGVLWGTF